LRARIFDDAFKCRRRAWYGLNMFREAVDLRHRYENKIGKEVVGMLSQFLGGHRDLEFYEEPVLKIEARVGGEWVLIRGVPDAMIVCGVDGLVLELMVTKEADPARLSYLIPRAVIYSYAAMLGSLSTASTLLIPVVGPIKLYEPLFYMIVPKKSCLLHVLEVLEEVLKEEQPPPARASSYCSSCLFRNICPSYDAQSF